MVSPAPARNKRRHRAVRPQILTRAALDQRSNAAKLFDQLTRAIQTDLGGAEELSTIEGALVEAFVGSYLAVLNLNVRMQRGEEIDFGAHAQACSSLVRLGSRLGLRRRTKQIEESLDDLRDEEEELVREAAESTRAVERHEPAHRIGDRARHIVGDQQQLARARF